MVQEITDKDLADLRASLSVCNPLVQSLVMRLERVEEEKSILLAEIYPPNGTAAIADWKALEAENTALHERVKRMEVLKPLAVFVAAIATMKPRENYIGDHGMGGYEECSQCEELIERAQEALKEAALKEGE